MANLQKPNPVTHALKVTAMVCPECDAIIADNLSALDGMQNVASNWQTNTVTITYDLNRVRLQEVEKLLTEIGYPPDPGFLHRKKRDWLHFTEQNELDNLNHVAHCCNKAPTGN